MTDLQFVIILLAIYTCPVIVWFIRVRPQLTGMEWRVMLCGLIATLSMLMPVFMWGYSAYVFVFLRIWLITIPLLIVVNAVNWVVAAVKKLRFCTIGGVMAAVLPLISGLLLGNWLSLIAGGCFLYMLLRARKEYLDE